MSRKSEFLKIPNENGGFICVQSHIFKEELDGTKRHYFEPSFRLMNDRVVRQDTFWEKRDVIGYKSKGYLLSSEKEWKEYAKKKFLEFKDTLLINPYAVAAGMKEPEYSDDEICDLNFHWGY